MTVPDDPTPPTLAEILAACLAVQAIYAARDAAAAARAQAAAAGSPRNSDQLPLTPEPERPAVETVPPPFSTSGSSQI
jgi:hypothetical protein